MPISPQSFRAIVSGRRHGVGAAVLRALLRVAETPYAWAVRRRNRQFDSGRLETFAAGVPVVSVGNLTLGGTGKTPLVQWVVRYVAAQGLRPAIVSRGYGAAAGAANDEMLELLAKLPDVPHVQNPDRVAAARTAVERHGCQLIVLDDGLQHRRLRRDLDIVLIDALEPFGFDHVFPRGTLREPLSGLARAGAVVLTRSDMVDDAQRTEIRRRVAALAPHAAWCEATHAPRQLRSVSGGTRPMETLQGKRVAAFCGIGNPAGFRHTLEHCGCQVTAWREFADHYAYGERDVSALATWAKASGAEAVVCTHKDLVKFHSDTLGPLPLWGLEIGLKFTAGEDQLSDLLRTVCQAAQV